MTTRSLLPDVAVVQSHMNGVASKMAVDHIDDEAVIALTHATQIHLQNVMARLATRKREVVQATQEKDDQDEPITLTLDDLFSTVKEAPQMLGQGSLIQLEFITKAKALASWPLLTGGHRNQEKRQVQQRQPPPPPPQEIAVNVVKEEEPTRGKGRGRGRGRGRGKRPPEQESDPATIKKAKR
jgi:hypothetical protein